MSDLEMHADLVDWDDVRRHDAWRRWNELSRGAPPFLAPAFFALVRPLSGEGEPLLATAQSGGRWIGALPLVRDGDTLRGLRGEHSPKFDYCGEPDGIDAIWSALRANHAWSRLVLAKIPVDSPLATRLPLLARADGCRAVIRPDVRHRFLALPGFEAKMSPKFRSNLRRCERNIGDLVLERLVAPTRADLDDALRIEAMAWKGAAGTSIADNRRVAHLYDVMVRLFGPRGRACLYFLRARGVRMATLFAVEDQRTLYALKIGHDPRQAAHSPGHLLVWKVAADAEERGKLELDFVGRDDEWKRKWTESTHDHVAIVVYRRSLRGIARYLAHEEIAPRIPTLPRGCQRDDRIGAHTALAHLRGRIAAGLGIRRAIQRPFQMRPGQGAPSPFAAGSWVRVRDEAAIRATLDPRERLRGLAFVPSQWQTCGGVYQVQQRVRRLRDDHGRFRPVGGTVLLAGVDCGGASGDAGCGRHCPLMFRDEWLEPAPAPHLGPPAASTARHARVKDAGEIAAGLNLLGRRDGLTFMPEMAAYAGRRFAIVERIERVFEHDRWIETRRPVYLLAGLHCSGAVLGGRGPCHRACALLWHEDWLLLDPEPT